MTCKLGPETLGIAVPNQGLPGAARGMKLRGPALIALGCQAALVAQIVTTVLGCTLAGLYILSGRSLWLCVLAYTVFDAVLEPALLLSFIH